MTAVIKIAIQTTASGGAQQVIGDLNAMDGAARRAQGGFGGLGGAIMGALGTASVAAIAGAGAAMAGFLASSVTAAAGFEQQMSGIKAVLAPTGAEFDALRQKALDLGASTAYGAAEAAEAIEMLAKNGLSATEILGGAADATLALAAATGGDLAGAADIMTDAMAIFGISAENVGEAIDGITGVTVASKFTIDDYRLALAQAGGVAGSVGVEFDDFNTAIAGISPLFASGSDAGTSFKTMLQRLAPTTGPAKDAMAELGLMTTSTTKIMNFLAEQGIAPLGSDLDTLGNQFTEFAAAQGWTTKETAKVWESFAQSTFFDEVTGNLKDMDEVAGILQEALSGLSEEQKNVALSTIFGTDAMRAAVGLADLGTEGFNELAGSIGQVDAAAQAATRLDNFSGALEQLKGAFETLQIQVGSYLLPYLTAFLNDVVTPGVNTLGTMADALFGNAEAFAALAPPLQQVVTFVQGLVPIAMELGAVLAANWQPVLAAIGAVIAAVVIPALASFVVSIAPVLAAVAAAIAIGMALYNAWNSNFMGIQTIVQGALAIVQSTVQSVMSVVLAFWQKNGADIMAFTQRAWAQIQQIIGTVAAIVAEIVKQVFGGIQQFIGAHGNEIVALLTYAWDEIKSMIDFSLNLIQGITTTVLGALRGDWDQAASGIKQIVQGFADFVLDKFDNILKLIESLGGRAASAGRAFIASLRDGIMGAIDNLISEAKTALQGLADLLPGSEPKDPTSPLRGLVGRGAAIVGNLQAGINAASLDLAPALAPAVGQVAAMGGRSVTNNATRNITYNATFNGVGSAGVSDAIARSLAGV